MIFKARVLFFLVLSVTRPEILLCQMSSPDDVIISQLQAISQLFSSYPPLGEFCQVSELTIQKKENGRWSGRNVYLVEIGPKSLGEGRHNICKDKECNLRPVAGY